MWELFKSIWESNSALDWSASGLVFLSTIIVLRLIIYAGTSRIALTVNDTASQIDNILVRCLATVKSIAIGCLAFYLASLTLALPPVFDETLQNFLVLVFLIQGAFWSNAILDYILIDWAGEKFANDPSVATALGSVGFLLRLAVWVIFLMLALGNMGLDVGPLIASLGIGGIAFALALQNVLGDLLGSFSIVFDKPFVVGDYIETEGFEGRVQNVGLKTTRLEALSGETLVLSNSDLLSSRIRNFEKRAKRRASFLLSVTYSTPLDKLEQIPSIVKEIIEGQKQTQYERSFLKKLGDRGIDFEVVYSMRGPNLADFGTVNHNINMEILRKFDIEGIEFAYHTQTIDVPNSG
mgnify:FL=1|jgi:small-conductance mechanosensitive channel|tara:strand:- start:3551 stop:4606 length:1056 start_codon:yes stop_codon:yes gene_type:complete